MAMTTPRGYHYNTIVIGAGISGLSCASRLLQDGRFQKPQSLLVLEGRDRLGGRINSVQVHGSRLDTGANWIHGVGTEDRRNPLMDILPHKQYKKLDGMVVFPAPAKRASTKRTTPAESDNDWVDVGDTNEPSHSARGTIPSHIAQRLTSTMWSMIGSLHELAASTPAAEAKQSSVLRSMTRPDVVHEAFKDLPHEYHRTMGGLLQFVENMEAAPLAAQSSEHERDHSGMGLLEFAIADFDGDQVFLQDGYAAVVQEVAKDLVSRDLVRLGREVSQINWNGDFITINAGSEVYTADVVICTLPLGVLQHHSKADSAPLFIPSLPQDKVEAIASLGFGTLDKVFLVYSHPWWTQEPYSSILQKGLIRRPSSSGDLGSEIPSGSSSEPDSIMGFTEDLAGIEIQPDGSTVPGARALSLINLHSLTGFPVLGCFVSCSNAIHVESLSDHKAGALVHKALCDWFGRDLPEAKEVHVTRWAQDRYSRGSYSHMITGLSETRHREAFQKPAVNPCGAELRFAGEHTSRNHFATAHGALMSGWREADAILRSGSA